MDVHVKKVEPSAILGEYILTFEAEGKVFMFIVGNVSIVHRATRQKQVFEILTLNTLPTYQVRNFAKRPMSNRSLVVFDKWINFQSLDS